MKGEKTAETSLRLAGLRWSPSLVIAGLQAGFKGVLITSLAGHSSLVVTFFWKIIVDN